MKEKIDGYEPAGFFEYLGAALFAGFWGGVVGLVLGFLSCTCSKGHDASALGSGLVGCAILGAIGAVIFVAYDDGERRKAAIAAAEKAESDRKAAAEAYAIAAAKAAEERRIKEQNDRFASWKQRVMSTITRMLTNLSNCNGDAAGNNLDGLWHLRKEGAVYESKEGSQRYTEFYAAEYAKLDKEIAQRMQLGVTSSLQSNEPSINNLNRIETGLTLLLAYKSNDYIPQLSDDEAARIVDALDNVRSGIEEANRITSVVSFDEYGVLGFVVSDPRKMTDNDVLSTTQSLAERLVLAKRIGSDPYAGASALDRDFFVESASLMWYYADKTPFSVVDFDEARSAYNAFTAMVAQDEKGNKFCFGKVEEVLARLYARYKIGGLSTVKQEEPYVEAWLDYQISRHDDDQCFTLASGLAWLELYDLEKKTLNTLVAHQVQLTAELQERLGFLEMGKTKNIRLFEVEDGPEFAYDSSSVDWKSDEFAVYFRKLAMKKMTMNYSLALDKWTKALPLKPGQKVSQDAIVQEFKQMTEDFDGEVICSLVDAYAVDLANVRQDNAVLFRFTSERSRCVSVLFSCEKYGRNLNVSIMTLFSPDSHMDPSTLERYAVAAKSNPYMESFRESLLQSLDDVLRVERSIYSEEPLQSDNQSSRTIIE